MDYEEAVKYLETPTFQSSRRGLSTMRALLRELGEPHEGLKYVHVAGTNGKGSTSALIESILRESGYRTGLYTSPHLQRFTERIRVNGREIPMAEVCKTVTEIKTAALRLRERGMIPTVFEQITTLAFLYFKAQGCDAVVLEAGLGGRLDATNVIGSSEVSVITTIDYDHMKELGATLDQIAGEKAGIIKDGGLTVMYPQREVVDRVIAERCRQKNARLVTVDFTALSMKRYSLEGQLFHFKGYNNLQIRLLGPHQIKNAAVAVTVAEELIKRGWDISVQDIQRGLEHTLWPGRLEIVHRHPTVLIDGAHNPQGVRALTDGLAKLFPNRSYIFIAGVLADKDYETMMETILPVSEAIITVTPDSVRALAGEKLTRILGKQGCESVCCGSVEEALEMAMKLAREEGEDVEEGIVCAFGSMYYIGNVRTYFLGNGDGGNKT